MQEGYIHIEKNKVYYNKWGNGPKLMIAFHGFGYDHSMFNILRKGLGHSFTVYSLDLPFHGRTQWKEKGYRPADIRSIAEHILRYEQKDQFTALGFSYGARIWMATLPLIHQYLSHLYLLAPDGLRTHRLGIAERTPIPLIVALDQLSKKPERLIRLANRLHKWHLINRFGKRFVHYHLGTIKNKQRLFRTWRSMQRFRVSAREVKDVLVKNQIKLTVIIGKRDSIIALSSVKRLVRDLPGAQLHLLNKSHFLIDGSIVRFIK